MQEGGGGGDLGGEEEGGMRGGFGRTVSLVSKGE